jgi:hypothetical protein
MKKIIYILILFSLYGCNLQRRTYCERKAQKVARILKDCPNIIDTTSTSDTVVIFDTIRYAIDNPIDSSSIDSLLFLYCDALANENKSSSNGQDSIKERIVRQYIFKECEKINDGTYHLQDQNKDTVTVVLKGRTISVFQKRKVVTVTKTLKIPCPSCDKTIFQKVKEDGIFWLIIFFAGALFPLFLRLLRKLLP